MKKRTYRAVNVKQIDPAKLNSMVEGKRISVGCDVAKEDFFAMLMDERYKKLITIKWKHPEQTREVVALLSNLPCRSLAVSMEPSSTYGDPLRHLLYEAGIPVFKTNPKRVHDAKEVYDGVPSKHDAKDASIIARFHLDGLSHPWLAKEEKRRDLKSWVSTMDLFASQVHQNQNRLEAMLARYWPEVPALLDLGRKTLLVLLQDFGGPVAISANSAKARKLMARTGGHYLKPEKIDAVLESARRTIGVGQSSEEKAAMRSVCQDILRAMASARQAEKKVTSLAKSNDTIQSMGTAAGLVTAAVLYVKLGDPRDYDSASSYEKAAGLNLKERSSGKYKGQKKISKRGSGMARRWLYWAAMRLAKDDPIVHAWHQRKIRRDGGKKIISIIAIMRKLIRALWHVSWGAVFDSSLLYDVNRLKMQDV